MESIKFPIVIKKRNGVMLGVSILEIVIGIIFGMCWRRTKECSYVDICIYWNNNCTFSFS